MLNKLTQLELATQRLGVSETTLLKTASLMGYIPPLVLDSIEGCRTYFFESDLQLIADYLADRSPARYGGRLNPLQPVNGQ